jgi:hypothetical protein
MAISGPTDSGDHQRRVVEVVRPAAIESTASKMIDPPFRFSGKDRMATSVLARE